MLSVIKVSELLTKESIGEIKTPIIQFLKFTSLLGEYSKNAVFIQGKEDWEIYLFESSLKMMKESYLNFYEIIDYILLSITDLKLRIIYRYDTVTFGESRYSTKKDLSPIHRIREHLLEQGEDMAQFENIVDEIRRHRLFHRFTEETTLFKKCAILGNILSEIYCDISERIPEITNILDDMLADRTAYIYDDTLDNIYRFRSYLLK